MKRRGALSLEATVLIAVALVAAAIAAALVLTSGHGATLKAVASVKLYDQCCVVSIKNVGTLDVTQVRIKAGHYDSGWMSTSIPPGQQRDIDFEYYALPIGPHRVEVWVKSGEREALAFTGRLTPRTWTQPLHHYYALNLQWTEIIAEEDCRVVVEQLSPEGKVENRWEATLSAGERWRVDAGDLRFLHIISTGRVSVYPSSIAPSHRSDDDYYSVAGSKLYLWIPSGAGRYGALFIASYDDGNTVRITDLADGDESRTVVLNRGGFLELPQAADTSPGEVWLVEATYPVTVVAGYPEDNSFHQVMSPDMKEYYFALVGNDPRLAIVALEDGTHVYVKDLDSGDEWSFTLNRGGRWARGFSYAHSSGYVEWRRMYVRADKPVLVMSQDRWSWGASLIASADNPGGVGRAYYADSGNGRYLYVCAPFGGRVTVRWGSSTEALDLEPGGWAKVDLGGQAIAFSVEASTPVVVYSVGPNRNEDIAVAAEV